MTDQPEYSGGKTNYYMVDVISPVDQRSDPYTAECQDIIEALGMDFNEGNAFKALWRRAAARLGKSKRGYTDGLYDAEKVEFYGKRLVELERRGKERIRVNCSECGEPWLDLHVCSIPVRASDPFGPRDADGWYTWNGDDTMRPAGLVETVLRDGFVNPPHNAEANEWSHGSESGDIVKWRPAIKL